MSCVTAHALIGSGGEGLPVGAGLSHRRAHGRFLTKIDVNPLLKVGPLSSLDLREPHALCKREQGKERKCSSSARERDVGVASV